MTITVAVTTTTTGTMTITTAGAIAACSLARSGLVTGAAGVRSPHPAVGRLR
jgi:hypothetical protein